MTRKEELLKEAARERIELGGRLILLSKDGDTEVYTCTFEEVVTIGEPEVYIWNGTSVKTVFGEEAWEYLPELGA